MHWLFDAAIVWGLAWFFLMMALAVHERARNEQRRDKPDEPASKVMTKCAAWGALVLAVIWLFVFFRAGK
jgi:hypothetical protein